MITTHQKACIFPQKLCSLNSIHSFTGFLLSTYTCHTLGTQNWVRHGPCSGGVLGSWRRSKQSRYINGKWQLRFIVSLTLYLKTASSTPTCQPALWILDLPAVSTTKWTSSLKISHLPPSLFPSPSPSSYPSPSPWPSPSTSLLSISFSRSPS